MLRSIAPFRSSERARSKQQSGPRVEINGRYCSPMRFVITEERRIMSGDWSSTLIIKAVIERWSSRRESVAGRTSGRRDSRDE